MLARFQSATVRFDPCLSGLMTNQIGMDRFSVFSDAGSVAAVAGGAGVLDRLFDGFTGFAGALLDPADDLVLLAFRVLEIVVGELGHFCFRLPLMMFQSPLISSFVIRLVLLFSAVSFRLP